MFLTTPSFNKIKYAIQSLHLNKAVGHDDIPSLFLKAGSDIILLFLYVFLDFMFTTGIYPDNCKIAKIIPVHKTGSKQEVYNYYPIFILSCFSKIFEKLTYVRLSNFFLEHEIFQPTQYGFLQGKSTVHPALDVITELYNNIY